MYTALAQCLASLSLPPRAVHCNASFARCHPSQWHLLSPVLPPLALASAQSKTQLFTPPSNSVIPASRQPLLSILTPSHHRWQFPDARHAPPFFQGNSQPSVRLPATPSS
ncbi:hypothetical protein L226DRAFT_538561 [Lentinus tigrinus ALCF2SS1-7]|uniref:uncharacterized protein n=1 Tax=Lentinus tigrinus ALCF2SS1-7 TaxID=1328758 RepID=UPI0011663CE1|nr:hypothetical protein L226DRAFT_538561 [Lentinus tigrinus ALCF2SS1-7]